MGYMAAVHGHAEAIIDLADQHTLNYWRLSGLILKGWAMAQEGKLEQGLALMRPSLDDRNKIGASWYQVRYLCMLVSTYLNRGDADQGLLALAEATNLAER